MPTPYFNAKPICLLDFTLAKQPNARINRARRQHHKRQVSRIKTMLFALRLNELLGVVLNVPSFLTFPVLAIRRNLAPLF